MSSFSFTAPFISKEQEQEERDAFSELERDQLHHDWYGTDVVPPESEGMKRQGVVLFQESMAAVPEEDKVEYVQALERAPELVESESPPLAFLRHHRFDAWEAAQHCTLYWKTRLAMFGPDRAFLPMTLEGAMQDEVEHLQKAFVMIVPPDSTGRQVFFINEIRCSPAVAPRESILRCFFYTLQVLLESESSQKRGLVAIANVRGYDLYTNFDRIRSRKMIAAQRCMPLVLKAGHCCTGSGKSVFSLILPVIKHLTGKHIRHRILVHAGSDTELVQRMELYGLTKESIPRILGGNFSRSDFEAWLTERREFEQKRDRQEAP